MSSGVDDYSYDYEYEVTLDDETMFDVERLDIEYVDDLALSADTRDPQLEFGLDNARHGTSSHRRRRPHARYIASCTVSASLSVLKKLENGSKTPNETDFVLTLKY